jgi:hypothetical protein
MCYSYNWIISSVQPLLIASVHAGLSLQIVGAKGGTRTPTGVTRQILSLVRLPIPPLSRGVQD